MALINLPEKFNEIKSSAEKVEFSDISLSDNFKEAFKNYIAENPAKGYSEVEWAEFSTKIITSSGKSIFLTNYWFYLSSELAGYLEGLAEQRELFKKVFSGEDLNLIATELRKGVSETRESFIKNYFSVNNYNEEDYFNFIKFVSEYSSWGGGKTIDREDYYVSPLMKAGNLLAETQSAVAEIAMLFFNEPHLRLAFHPTFVSSTSSSSYRQGRNLGKILFYDSSRGGFVFKLINYLLENDKQAPLFDCLIEKNSELGSFNLEYEAYRLTSFFKVSDKLLGEEDLVRGDKPRFFTDPFEYDSRYYYLSNQWTDGTESRLDIQTLIPLFNILYDDYKIISEDGEYVLKEINIVKPVILPKPFLLLAGISGTGKTRFVSQQASLFGTGTNNYCLVSVRPDWHEPSDLLGYVSRLSGTPVYVSTKVLDFIIKAWKVAAPKASADGAGELDLTAIPYWLCLDEMNLAPVEQYFADYLSVLESRKFRNNTYYCEPLLDKALLQDLNNGTGNIKADLGLGNDDLLWDYFLNHGISIPPNLIVAGTVNMDETTHGFSRKVIDRAITFDFGEFFPNDYDSFFHSKNRPQAFSYSMLTQATQADLSGTYDSDGEKTIAFLKTVNEVLKQTPFELAYRALNELLLQVVCFEPSSESQLQAVWDDFLMAKVLPRIDGDEDKLRIRKGDETVSNLLDALSDILSEQLNTIWEETRRDFHRQKIDGSEVDGISCRSKAKLAWMKNRLEINTFTSFWP